MNVRMDPQISRRFYAQLVVVLFCAALVKAFYSTTSVNQLRWILAPTTLLVEIVSGSRFRFESYAGYINSDRSFLIAASCAGVNFLIASFLLLSLRLLWRHRGDGIRWRLIPGIAAMAYLTTLLANTVRISTALRLRASSVAADWLNPNQLHRFEGIVIYFGFLLLLFVVSERLTCRGERRPKASLVRQLLFPMAIYYGTTLGIPLVNTVRTGALESGFWEHSVFVLLIPPLIILPVAAFDYLGTRAAVTPPGTLIDDKIGMT